MTMETDQHIAARGARWIATHPRRPPEDREPIEDDTSRLSRLRSTINRHLGASPNG